MPQDPTPTTSSTAASSKLDLAHDAMPPRPSAPIIRDPVERARRITAELNRLADDYFIEGGNVYSREALRRVQSGLEEGRYRASPVDDALRETVIKAFKKT